MDDTSTQNTILRIYHAHTDISAGRVTTEIIPCQVDLTAIFQQDISAFTRIDTVPAQRDPMTAGQMNVVFLAPDHIP